MKTNTIWGLLRISLGLVFLWAFVDKLLGLGFTTCRDAESGAVNVLCDSAWLSGGSPTTGFLRFGTTGPFEGIFQAMAGNLFIDWIFMLGLLFIGVAVTFGVMMRLGAYAGALMLMLMYVAAMPPEHHPFIDDHIIYSIALIGLARIGAGNYMGLGNWWQNLKIVKQYKVLA